MNYLALEDEMLSYIATVENIKQERVGIDAFIHYLDEQLTKLNKIAIGFDYTKVPNYGEALERFGKTTPPENKNRALSNDNQNSRKTRAGK